MVSTLVAAFEPTGSEAASWGYSAHAGGEAPTLPNAPYWVRVERQATGSEETLYCRESGVAVGV